MLALEVNKRWVEICGQHNLVDRRIGERYSLRGHMTQTSVIRVNLSEWTGSGKHMRRDFGSSKEQAPSVNGVRPSQSLGGNEHGQARMHNHERFVHPAERE